jgi:hypothetical protein
MISLLFCIAVAVLGAIAFHTANVSPNPSKPRVVTIREASRAVMWGGIVLGLVVVVAWVGGIRSFPLPR